MSFLLDADDDYIERFRRFLYPKLHGFLKLFGGYSVGKTGKNQYVGTLDMSDEELERVLAKLGFERNPIACYKRNEHGNGSIGSWALRSHDDPFGELEVDRQLHVTLFHPVNGSGVAVYAHDEYDWQDKPIAHLKGRDFRPEDGVEYTKELLYSERVDV
jgi:hypothetical protein